MKNIVILKIGEVLKNPITIIYGARLIGSLVSLVTILFLVERGGLKSVGVYGLFLALINLLSILAGIGRSTLILREYKGSNRNSVLSQNRGLVVMAALLLIPIISLVSLMYEEDFSGDRAWAILLFGSVLLKALNNIDYNVLRLKSKFLECALILAVVPIGNFVGILVFNQGSKVIDVVIPLSISNLIGWVFGVVFLRASGASYIKFWPSQMKPFGAKIKESLDVMLVDICSTLSNSGLITIAGVIFAPDQLGKLNLLVRVFVPLNFLLLALRTVIGGKLAAIVAKNKNEDISKQFNLYRNVSITGNSIVGIILMTLVLFYTKHMEIFDLELALMAWIIFLSYLLIGLFGPIELYLITIHQESRVVYENGVSLLLLILIVGFSIWLPNLILLVAGFSMVEIVKKRRLWNFKRTLATV